jgi:hypothetical protein
VQLICPECSTTKTREALSWRLEICPTCHERGNEVYLVNAKRSAAASPPPATELSDVVKQFLGSPGGPTLQH